MNLDLIESESESEMSSDSEVSHSRRHILLSSSREWILQLFAKEAENLIKEVSSNFSDGNLIPQKAKWNKPSYKFVNIS
jgi:hypothetical protein